MRLERIPAADARAFVAEHHYSRSCAAGVMRYGWLDDADRLMAVSVYDLGTRPTQSGVFGPEYADRVMHHHRLAVHPDVPHGRTSQFLAATLRQLKQDRDVWAVVTYADMGQGHYGTIYQACNALYTGVRTKGNLYFTKPDGSLGVTRSLPGTWAERRAEAERLGWIEHRSLGKHRYVFLLTKKHPPLRWDVEPYPKRQETS